MPFSVHPLLSRSLPLVAVAVLAVCAPAAAKQLYEYVDENGIRHFSDVAPDTDAPVKRTRVEVELRPLIRLETRPSEQHGSVVFVHNLGAGPIEVELSLEQAVNTISTPMLPARFILPAQSSDELARIGIADPYRDSSYRVEAEVIPGDPTARPDPAVRYRLPFAPGTRYAVGQAFNGAFSHNDEQNRHAVDLGVAEGAPVVAARDGVVFQVERDFHESGGDRDRLAARANYVRVLHEDGSMAVYAHLAYESVLVRPGDVVLTGQRIGAAGATGFATGPHLHFVIQRNAGLRLVSIPFQFEGPEGPYTPVTSRGWQRAP